MNLVLIETSGNQNYIFATNKLRENVGASELTYQVGTKIVIEEVGGRDYEYSKDKNGNALRKLLLAERQLEQSTEPDAVEIIVATSGKALLLTKTRKKAEEIVSKVTKRALMEMPGLTVHGAIESVKDDLTDVGVAVRNVHRKLENARHRVPSNMQRFLRLPHVEPCATSGLPARAIYKHESLPNKPEEFRPHSSLSIVKQENSEVGRRRMEKILSSLNPNIHLPSSIKNLEEKFDLTKWIAVVHADGNGLGEIFLNFQKNSNATSGREYIDRYRQFSIALDICTINAASFAIGKFQNSFQAELLKAKATETIEIPLIPLVLGGDDLTIICDGQYALTLTRDFLGKFEEETEKLDPEGHFREVTDLLQDGLISKIANNAFGNSNEHSPSITRLGICAGVAIVKPHYPFHQAYELAKGLLTSAKLVKTKVQHEPVDAKVSLPCSAMDFHILYDSSGVELNEIREKLKVGENDESQTYLYAKPYIVTNLKEKALDPAWLIPRNWANLSDRVRVMRATDGDDRTKRKLPNSQLHRIRESLRRGKDETDTEVNLFSHRYKDAGFDELLWRKDDPKSLFFPERHKKGGVEKDGHTTHFLDALDVVEFWKGSDGEKKSESAQATANGGAE